MVEIIFKINFCAVPDFKRVEPVNTSGPTLTSTGYCAISLITACSLHEIDTVVAPIVLANVKTAYNIWRFATRGNSYNDIF